MSRTLAESLDRLSKAFKNAESTLLAQGFAAVREFEPKGFRIHWFDGRIRNGDRRPVIECSALQRIDYAKELTAFMDACEVESQRIVGLIEETVAPLEAIEDSKGNI